MDPKEQSRYFLKYEPFPVSPCLCWWNPMYKKQLCGVFSWACNLGCFVLPANYPVGDVLFVFSSASELVRSQQFLLNICESFLCHLTVISRSKVPRSLTCTIANANDWPSHFWSLNFPSVLQSLSRVENNKSDNVILPSREYFQDFPKSFLL